MRESDIQSVGAGLLALALLRTASVAQAAQTVTLYVTDAQGTVVAQMTPQGAGQPNQVIYTAAYRPYGTQVLGTPQDGPGYTGHVNDADSGLVYMQQRYYDPESQRFASVDPVVPAPGNVFNFNRYDYANNNPIKNIDLDGRNITEALGGLFYETGSFFTGNGFHGNQIVGALKDGYNGEGGGVVHAALQDVGTISAAAGVAGVVKGGATLIVSRFAAKEAVEEGASIAKGAEKLTKDVIERKAPGADGASSRHIVEKLEGKTNSVTHQVTKDGQIIHQHQTHIGKYGTQRQFPDKWVEHPKVPKEEGR